MPVEVTERALRDALALAGERDGDDAPAAQAALEWMGWEGEGSLWLRRYDVQLFVWYTLPRKFLASLEHKREAAAALARTLDRLGERAATYAEVCRSPETDELLCVWEAEDPAASQRLRDLLDRSGIEPPDTDRLAWGHVMGLEEARVREQVAIALEEATEDGRLVPGSPGFRRRQAEVASAALLEPWSDDDGQSRLDAVHAERLERWLERGRTRGSAERRTILAPVAAVVAADAPPVEEEATRDAVAPALWLLERADDGIALTQTGALNRALVREAVERWPAWWRSDLFGPPNREDEVTPMHELHGLCADCGSSGGPASGSSSRPAGAPSKETRRRCSKRSRVSCSSAKAFAPRAPNSRSRSCWTAWRPTTAMASPRGSSPRLPPRAGSRTDSSRAFATSAGRLPSSCARRRRSGSSRVARVARASHVIRSC